ncbi:MAG: Gfo/Idh/MocA family oxidoreductase [Actinomycetota bacterium]
MTATEPALGVIGYGYWGPNLVRDLDGLEGVRLARICDPDERKLKAAREAHPGVDLTGDTGAVTGAADLDAVVIAAPAVTHYSLAKEALLAGKHVFVEKPLALDVTEGRELLELSERTGLTLMVGHIFLYHPAVRFMKRFLDEGGAGEVRYAYSQRLNLGRVRHDENCLWSLAPHDVSLMLHLLGRRPVSVTSLGASYLRPGIEDVVFFTMTFPGGLLGNVHVSWLDPRKVRMFTVVGSEKMLVFDDMAEGKVRIFDRRVYPVTEREVMGYGEELRIHFGEEETPDIEMEEPLLAECRAFRDSVLGGPPPLSAGRQGLEVLEVLDAASRSMADGGQPAAV